VDEGDWRWKRCSDEASKVTHNHFVELVALSLLEG